MRENRSVTRRNGAACVKAARNLPSTVGQRLAERIEQLTHAITGASVEGVENARDVDRTASPAARQDLPLLEHPGGRGAAADDRHVHVVKRRRRAQREARVTVDRPVLVG